MRTRWLTTYFKSREQLEKWQATKIARFKKEVLTHSPFYQPYLHKPLSEFPIMNKSLMMDQFDHLNTRRIEKNHALSVALKAERSRNFSPMIGDVSVGLSSGTSGNRGLFMASRRERLAWAGILMAKALPRSPLRRQKIAFFLRANNNLYTTLERGNYIQFVFFDLTKSLNDHLEALDKYSPTILTAPPSVLKLIAQAQERKQIQIFPTQIFCIAEVLDPLDQQFMETIFNQKLHQIYQATEGFLAITDQNYQLRLNEEYIHVEKEWIDRSSGRFVPIITDFTRTTQPIVRYRLDDVLIEEPLLALSPFTYLKAIEGRCDDICYLLNSHDDWVPLFADSLRQCLIISGVPFHDYRLIQPSPQRFEIALDPFPNLQDRARIEAAIKQLCNTQDCRAPTLAFEHLKPWVFSKKLKRIERTFNLSQRAY